VLTDVIIDAKIGKNLTFEQINEGTGLSIAFVTAAMLGQHPLPADAAKVVAEKLDLDDHAVRLLQTIPVRGSIPTAASGLLSRSTASACRPSHSEETVENCF
jgi:cyanate lyase